MVGSNSCDGEMLRRITVREGWSWAGHEMALRSSRDGPGCIPGSSLAVPGGLSTTQPAGQQLPFRPSVPFNRRDQTVSAIRTTDHINVCPETGQLISCYRGSLGYSGGGCGGL